MLLVKLKQDGVDSRKLAAIDAVVGEEDGHSSIWIRGTRSAL